ncbi:MAG TPA: TIM-barrel domain-containing protein [Bacteroidales bacterium]|nr:TIM-barrel domain-containing protein [Bacteroidales bacterium]
MKCFTLIALWLPILLSGCNNTLFRKTSDGIRITLTQRQATDTKSLRLQVITDDIIRVSASPDRFFKDPKSLITSYGETKKTGWDAVQVGDIIVLTTAKLKATVSMTTGEIIFSDINNKVLLREKVGGGKTFNPINIDGTSGWSFRQEFESPVDEAFYGLGQHQSDEFNYKGRNETLYQYNTKVSVPFVVSSKNYGILWDNYSLTRFGDQQPYANLDQFRLFDKNGKEGGLTATYRSDNNSKPSFVERQEKTIDYENLETIRNFPKDFPFNKATIRWEGSIQPLQNGLFHFILYYAGYTKVYLDDSLVVAERWRTSWNPNSYKFTAYLNKTARHKLRIEWIPDGGISYISLKALSPISTEEQNRLSLWSEMGSQMDYYFIRGDNADRVISGYRTLTGKAQVMPKWAFGYWQSRERYKTQEELLSILRTFRQQHFPIDNIVQDWSYWKENSWGSHEPDTTRFPNLEGMVKEVHDSSAHIMISVWPKFYSSTEHYKEFADKGWMFLQAVKDSVRDWIGPGYVGSFYDAYSEGARKLFWNQMNEHLFVKGFDAWWMDASEPDILSNSSMEYRKKLMNPTALGSSTEYFNAYGLMNAKGIYEGQRKTNNNQRVFLLTRSGFAGSQRYAASIWSGDIGTRWEDMKAQISAGLNFSISGNPYWTMDDGGFCVEKRYERAKEGSEDRNEWRELNLRWHQFGAFVPLFRSHGQYPLREPWNIAPVGSPVYLNLLYYTELRYRLMPYIYTLAGKCYFDDYTIMRPLVMDFGMDDKVLNVDDQYMFGSHLMICPVYRYQARSRSVYFPKGDGWYNLYNGSFQKGGKRSLVDAPLDRMPVFVPAGSILTLGEKVENTSQPQTNLTLLVYAGSDGSFNLYEDENVNYNYEKGAYSTISFRWNDTDRTLTIYDRKGSFKNMISERTLKVILVTPEHPIGLDSEWNMGKTVQYSGKQLMITFKANDLIF